MKSSPAAYAVIFDMDGVLVNSYEPHYQSWADSCAKRSFPLDRDSFAKLFGQSFAAFAEALRTRPMSPAEVQEWYDEKEQLYRDIIERDFPEIDGAGNLIAGLHNAGILVGVASSGPRGNVDCLIRHLSNAHLIKTTVSANDVTHVKPHPEPFLCCAAKLGIEPPYCVVVEDSVHGLQAGRSAGMATIGLTGTSPAEELANYADLVVTSLNSITPEVVVRLAKSSGFSK